LPNGFADSVLHSSPPIRWLNYIRSNRANFAARAATRFARAGRFGAVHARNQDRDRNEYSTAFHSSDVVNLRIGKSPRPLSLRPVDEIARIYEAWTLLAKFRR
jgi:hypothetical protein